MPSMHSTCILAFFLLADVANGSSFLSRVNEGGEELTHEMEVSILQEIELVLDREQAGATRSRLARIEDLLATTFKAMPKTEAGKLQHTAVRYLLHKYFVQQHAWFVRGLADLGDLPSPNESSPTGILQDKVDDFIQGAFEKRLGGQGLDLSSVALLVATFENLVHSETMLRLNQTLRVMEVDTSGELDVRKVDDILESYFMGFLMALDFGKVQPRHLKLIQSKVFAIFPTWSKTRDFLRDIRSRSGFNKAFFNRVELEGVVEQVHDEYGRWQDKECQGLKSQLLTIEDKTLGTNGSGRVRIVDFYGSALRDGNWQFSETMDYLQHNGALDLNVQDVPRVVIPNYINSPSNCLASSKFYSVCCINECESLMDRIEHRFASPLAEPDEIVEFISTLPSSTVSDGRTLPEALKRRLQDIASTHGGVVPLHGRLFAQWMHHAYPRECTYPHISGTVTPQTPLDYSKTKNVKATVKKDQMEVIVKKHAETESSTPVDSDEITAWTHHEELYVGSAHLHRLQKTRRARSGWMQSLRPVLYIGVAIAAVWTLVGRSVSGTKSAAFACNMGGKDVYV